MDFERFIWLPLYDAFRNWLFSEEAKILFELKNELAVFDLSYGTNLELGSIQDNLSCF